MLDELTTPTELEGEVLGPVTVALTPDRIAFYADTTGDDPARWVHQAPPGFASVLLFAVADAAFALSVNAEIDAVGVQWSINVFRAAKPGEEVIGESRIIHRGRQSMVCELTVTAGDGRILARGQSTALPVGRGSHKGSAPPDVRKEPSPAAE